MFSLDHQLRKHADLEQLLESLESAKGGGRTDANKLWSRALQASAYEEKRRAREIIEKGLRKALAASRKEIAKALREAPAP